MRRLLRALIHKQPFNPLTPQVVEDPTTTATASGKQQREGVRARHHNSKLTRDLTQLTLEEDARTDFQPNANRESHRSIKRMQHACAMAQWRHCAQAQSPQCAAAPRPLSPWASTYVAARPQRVPSPAPCPNSAFNHSHAHPGRHGGAVYYPNYRGKSQGTART